MAFAEFAKAKNRVDESVDVGEIEELVLDGCKCKQLTNEDAAFLSQFAKLNALSLNSTYLTSLANFPSLPNLVSLELSDNRLSSASQLEILVSTCPKLESISLAGNRFERIEDLEPLNGLAKLEELDIELNPFSQKKDDEVRARAQLFKAFPKLQVVDGYDREGRLLSDDSEEEEEDVDSKPAAKASQPSASVLTESSAAENVLEQFYNANFEDDDDEEEEDFDPDSFSEDEDDSEDEDESLKRPLSEEEEEEPKRPRRSSS